MGQETTTKEGDENPACNPQKGEGEEDDASSKEEELSVPFSKEDALRRKRRERGRAGSKLRRFGTVVGVFLFIPWWRSVIRINLSAEKHNDSPVLP